MSKYVTLYKKENYLSRSMIDSTEIEYDSVYTDYIHDQLSSFEPLYFYISLICCPKPMKVLLWNMKMIEKSV